MDPVDSPIVFFEIRDCDSLIFIPYPILTDREGLICAPGLDCPCSFYIALEANPYSECVNPDSIIHVLSGRSKIFGLDHACSALVLGSFFNYTNLQHIRRCFFNIRIYGHQRHFISGEILKYLSCDYTQIPPVHWLWDGHLEEILLSSICDTAGNCTPRQKFTKVYSNPQAINEYYSCYPFGRAKYRYHLDYSQSDFSFTSVMSESIWFNVANSCSNFFWMCKPRDSLEWIKIPHNLFLSLDSTSAWMIISWDTGKDTIHYGDPGTFWFKPPDKHIGWRQFGVLTDSTKIPSSYTGKIKVCLMDVTNAPVVAFGEPTHLHPTDKCCYDDYTYIDTTTGDTLFYPHMVPAPPEPVCFEFTVGSGITEPIQTTSSQLSLEVHDIVTDNFTLSYALTGAGELAIYDIMGHMIWRKGVTGSGSEKIECADWRSGVYFAKIRADGDRIVKSMIVIK